VVVADDERRELRKPGTDPEKALTLEVAKLFGMSPRTLMNRPGSAGAGGVDPDPHGAVLLDGFNHVAILTGDTDRLVAFYQEVFGAEVDFDLRPQDGMRLTLLKIGPTSEFNVFELDGNEESNRQTPMFARGRLDHVGLQARSLEAFDEIRSRLMARGASDGFVTDFGPIFSLFFTDPDGLEAEVCVPNPDAVPGMLNPPGTPAARYSVE
jgi:catechol 2,3-dioxygenase-like lactoylglutathione lyase family enzyme